MRASQHQSFAHHSSNGITASCTSASHGQETAFGKADLVTERRSNLSRASQSSDAATADRTQQPEYDQDNQHQAESAAEPASAIAAIAVVARRRQAAGSAE